MARKRMVTRTIKTTNAVVLRVNLETQETVKEMVTVSGVFKDNKNLLKQISKKDPENIKTVSVLSTEITDKLYGMTEEKFVEMAEELPKHVAY